MLRAIRAIQPRWVLGENVYGIVNWSRGMVFEEVQTDLEAEGYEVQPVVLPACALGAPHRRDRVWFVGCKRINTNTNDYTNSGKSRADEEASEKKGIQEQNKVQHPIKPNTVRPENEEVFADPNGKRQQEPGKPDRSMRFKSFATEKASWSDDDGRWPTQPPVCSGDDGLSDQLDRITLSKLRKESLKAYGNAIVPQVAYEIFKVIATMEK